MWAVIPVKALDQAKRRLSSRLAPDARAALCGLMLDEVVEALGQARQVDGIVVVTSDRAVRSRLGARGVHCIAEARSDGINPALCRARDYLAEHGRRDMLVVPGDVPLARGVDIDAVISEQRRVCNGVTLVASHDGLGTNCLAVPVSAPFDFAFGEDSAKKHALNAARAGLELTQMVLDHIALDIDDPEDLSRLIERAPGSRTAQLLNVFGVAGGKVPAE